VHPNPDFQQRYAFTVQHADAMRTARMRRPRIDQFGKPKLLDSPQALKRPRFEDAPHRVLELGGSKLD
jgi:hypothetical protein